MSHRGQLFRLYRSLAIVFAPALVSTSLKMTEAKYRSARLAAGRGRPALPRRSYARQRIVILKRYTPRADEERPYLSSQSLILPLLKCHFDRSVSVVEKSPTEVTRLPHYYNLFRPLKRCGVRDTVASVPATFGFFFFARKRTFIFPFLKKKFVTISKVDHSGSAFSPLEKSKIHFFSFQKKPVCLISEREP